MAGFGLEIKVSMVKYGVVWRGLVGQGLVWEFVASKQQIQIFY